VHSIVSYLQSNVCSLDKQIIILLLLLFFEIVLPPYIVHADVFIQLGKLGLSLYLSSVLFRFCVWLWELVMSGWLRKSWSTTFTWLWTSWCLYWRRTGRTSELSTSRAPWESHSASIRDFVPSFFHK